MRILLIVFLLVGKVSLGQVLGDLQADDRQLSHDFNFTVYANATGELIFDIIVDQRGNVTSCQLNKEQSTVNNTPAMIISKNRILKEMKFVEGYIFPQWHRGQVKMTVRPQSVND